MFYSWKPYVSVAKRREKAAREMAKARARGEVVSPVVIAGRAIAQTFWGKAWCVNLERYSDYSNRLPRGRTYVRNGSVVDLQIGEGIVNARVAGSSMYRVVVKIKILPEGQWRALRRKCAGGFDSLVELLQGRFSKGVMEHLCRPESGLFPSPREISFDCSCPDWAGMCKHVAATLYGVVARLDEKPELLFRLRRVDEAELIESASRRAPITKPAARSERLLDTKLVAELFGIDIAGEIFFNNIQRLLGQRDSHDLADVLEVYELCLLLGFRGRYGLGGQAELRTVIETVKEKLRRIRGYTADLSPYWAIPPGKVKVMGSDPWVKRLLWMAVGSLVLVVVLFGIYKISLGAGASELRAIPTLARG